MGDTIWIVTTMHDARRGPSDAKACGWFPTEAEAVEAVLENRCDLYEGSWDLVAVERVDVGLYGCDPDPFWFRWGGGGYETCEPPAWATSISCLGMC